MNAPAPTPGESSRSSMTRASLIEATLLTILDVGLAGVSARSVAARAGVNQALIFYHFGSLTGLIDAAYDASVAEATQRYLAALGPATTAQELLTAARNLSEQESARSDTVLMAQLLAAAHHDPALNETARHALTRWSRALERIVETALNQAGLDAVFDAHALTDVVVSGFIGLALVDTVDDERGRHGRTALADLSNLLTSIGALPAPARRTVRSYLTRTHRNR